MQQIVDSLVDEMPSESLHLNCEIESITWNQPHPVTVHSTNGDQYSADHVILTVSLGVLKKKCNSSFFNPPQLIFPQLIFLQLERCFQPVVTNSPNEEHVQQADVLQPSTSSADGLTPQAKPLSPPQSHEDEFTTNNHFLGHQ